VAWLHGASVGESLSILPIVAALIARGWKCVVTTGTVTSAKLLQERLPDGAYHQFAPLDRRSWVNRFLNHWRPGLVVWTESELWPNSLSAISKRGIPIALVNARLSDKAFNGWKRWPGFARSVVNCFSIVLAQSDEDAVRFKSLGAQKVHMIGNLKFASAATDIDDDALNTLRQIIVQRPAWLAASIHPGEDSIVATAHRSLKHAHGKLLTVVVPRHPDRAKLMRKTFEAAGLKSAMRSDGEMPSDQTDIYIADTMGELGLFYRLVDVVFVGKSLAVGGGQNPIEPAQLGCALLFGPYMGNFRDTASELVSVGAALQVNNADELADQVSRLLSEQASRAAMKAAAKAWFASHSASSPDTLALLEPYLNKPSP